MTSDEELNYWKDRFITYWSQSGYGSFPIELKKDYIRGLVDSGANLQINRAEDHDEAVSVLDEVLLYDPLLESFQKQVRRYEELSPKAFQFLKLPALLDSEKSAIRALAKEGSLTLGAVGKWVIRSIVQDHQKTKITIAKQSQKPMTAKIPKNDIETAVGNKILELAKDVLPGAQELQNIKVTVVAPNVFQFSIEFEWTQNEATIESDLTEWITGDTKKIPLDKIKNEALASIASLTGLESLAPTLASITIQKPADPTLHAKIGKYGNRKQLVIIRGGKFHVEGKAGANDEDVEAKLSAFEVTRFLKDVKEHYTIHRRLDNFISANKIYDREKTDIQSKLISTSQIDCHGFFIMIFDKTIQINEGQGLEGKRNDFEVELVTFEYDHTTGDWRIRTPEYSRRIRDAFISTLHELSRQSKKSSTPRTRNST